MVYQINRENSSNRASGDTISWVRLQDLNEDLDSIFKRMDDRNIALTYNWSWQCTQIVDNSNSITVNITWTDFWVSPYRLYIQEAWDPKKYTIQYSSWGIPQTVLYA